MQTKRARYQNGSISKRQTAKGFQWRFRYYTVENGERVAKELRFDPREFPTEKDVLKATEGLRHELNSGSDYGRVKPPSVKVLGEQWYAEHAKTKKRSTQQSYRLALNRVAATFGGQILHEINPLEFKRWLLSLPLSGSQRAQTKLVLKQIIDYAILGRMTRLEHNPMSLFKLGGTTKRIKKRIVLTPEEFRRLVLCTRKPFDRLVLITGMLGLRISESLALQWEDFDYELGVVKIQRSWTHNVISTTKTDTSSAVLPVPSALLEAISKWSEDKSNEWLFPSHKSSSGLFHASTIQQKVLWLACDKAGIRRIGWHALRHSYRSWLDAAKITMGVSKDMMRHADISTTMNVYGRALPSGMKDAAEAVAGLLARGNANE